MPPPRAAAVPSDHAPSRQLVNRLTARERQVLRHIIAAGDTLGIARALGVAPSTARTHLQNVPEAGCPHPAASGGARGRRRHRRRAVTSGCHRRRTSAGARWGRRPPCPAGASHHARDSPPAGRRPTVLRRGPRDASRRGTRPARGGRGAPTRWGSTIGSAHSSSAVPVTSRMTDTISRTETPCPSPTLAVSSVSSPAPSARAAATCAEAMSATWTKSRMQVPSGVS
ncbi:LuxR C-terminal-related transcriptional regulator [Modestobacter sp. DSM 44400]|uniref:LuxR C-terminal-related transcriptional regulator n=1 Tax=Modestobacter sp. DSM 44400 TaxID=1550230 RepID=UPI00352AF11E